MMTSSGDPKPLPCGCPPAVAGQICHVRGVCTDPVVARLGWYAGPVYGWGACPLGCGPVGGDLVGQWDTTAPPPGAEHVRDLPHGFVRLWPHVFARKPQLGVCIGTRSLAAPLPLAAPTVADREETISAAVAAQPR